VLYQLEDMIPIWWDRDPSDPSPGAEDRYDHYGSQVSPAMVFGGTDMLEEWDALNIDLYVDIYNELADFESPLQIEVDFSKNEFDQYIMNSDIVLTDDLSSDNNQVYFLVTGWTTETPRDPGYWNYKVLASRQSELTVNTAGSNVQYSRIFDDLQLNDYWLEEELRAVVFVQSMETSQILQAAQNIISNTGTDDQVITAITDVINYPNPFNPSTVISFHIAENRDQEDVGLTIFNLKGQKIKEVTISYSSSGNYSYTWNGTDQQGVTVNSGIYFYKISTNLFDSINKMIMMK